MSSPSEASRYIFLATRPVLYQRAVQAKKTLAVPVWDVTASCCFQIIDFNTFFTSHTGTAIVFQSLLWTSMQKDLGGLKNTRRALLGAGARFEYYLPHYHLITK